MLSLGLAVTSSLTSVDALVRGPYSAGGVLPRVVLDFDDNKYVLDSGGVSFDKAFMGSSPKLTYSTAAGSNSTMVNSSGEIVWAPHNLALNSATPATQTIAVRSGAQYTVRVTGAGSMALTGAGTGTATDGIPATITASTTSLTITLTGSLDTVAVYRSDLGGMAPVPGAATGFEYYVPTNGAAEYLPRVGHHVYNGSAWVNEGLLIESESRTNLVTYSEDFANPAWLKTDATISDTLTSSPDGQTNGRTVTFAGTNDLLRFIGPSCSVGQSYSVSIWAKAGTSTSVRFSILFSGSGLGSVQEDITLTSEWQRFTISGTVPSGTPDTARMRFTSLEAGSIQIFGAQLEQGSTPSSYIPTNGSQGIRTAQSLTVPPAEFGWNSDAVSIQMDGRMTYSDEGVEEQQTLLAWGDPTATNYIATNLDTDSTDIGEINFEQDNAGTTETLTSDTLSPGTLVPFNISSRHGSTFVNGAVDGAAENADTTPTALPDLSGTNLQIALDFMGTIGTFRQWDEDIGDTGIEEATS